MAKKKGKKGGGDGEGSGASKMDEAEVRTLEYYQVKVADMTEKLDRLKNKLENVTQENLTLSKAQTKFYNDKQDIVEFLNIKVGEHERMITSLENQNKTLEEEKFLIDERCKQEMETLQTSTSSEVDRLTFDCQKLKTDLVELSSFSSQRDEMSLQLKQIKAVLEKKEIDYRENVHILERKVLQDKSQMKREMLQKVNEAVANFRKVADQQMAETTKRAIRENMSISSQLKKMSQKTTEFIIENDELKSQIRILKRQNQLLSDSEKELAKKSNANQKVIKMLVEKLKESDEMLELAFEENDFSGGNEAADPFTAPGAESHPVITEEMMEEIQVMQDDYNELVERMTDVHVVGKDLKFLLDEAASAVGTENESDVLDYIHSNLTAIVNRISQLTNFGQSSAGSIVGDPFMNQSYKEEVYEEMIPTASGDIYPSQSQEEIGKDDKQQGYEEYQENQGGSDEGYDEGFGGGTSRPDTQPSSNGSQAGEGQQQIQRLTITPTDRKRSLKNNFQKTLENNFLKMITPPNESANNNNRKPSLISYKKVDGGKKREVAIQTSAQSFGPQTSVKYLLGEVRPWGGRAEFLPAKGLSYFPRNANHLTQSFKVEIRKGPTTKPTLSLDLIKV